MAMGMKRCASSFELFAALVDFMYSQAIDAISKKDWKVSKA
jgi:hypothetical protein